MLQIFDFPLFNSDVFPVFLYIIIYEIDLIWVFHNLIDKKLQLSHNFYLY